MIIIMLGMVANSILNRSVQSLNRKIGIKRVWFYRDEPYFLLSPISPYQNSISLAVYTKTYVIIRFMRINRR